MPPSVAKLLEQILETQPILHGAGSMTAEALSALAARASARLIQNSAETGCGATTLLLSHLGARHTVFTLDVGNSVSNVRQSGLLRSEAVQFIEGPSQVTLPRHCFSGRLQLALIDGPHAYPFPDLEYYYLYPHLDAGALLVVDDIQIRSINNLFEFLRSDPMFRLEEVVRSTAFFVRTEAPTFDPRGDGWQQQPYNQRTLLQYDWRARLTGAVSGADFRRLRHLHQKLAGMRSACRVRIRSPRAADHVPGGGLVSGTARLEGDAHLWVLVHRGDVNGWWPQGNGEIPVQEAEWEVGVKYGEPEDIGFEFEIAALIVTRTIHEEWQAWVHSANTTGMAPPTCLPKRRSILAADYVVVRKVRF